MKTLLIFPGQGSQFVGMGKSIFDNYNSSKDIFGKASYALNFDVSELCFNGNENELTISKNTQPLLFCVSCAILSSLKEHFGEKLNKLNISGVAGHSLGEYSALYASESIQFEEGCRILRKRGEAMQKACEIEKGGMLAVIGGSKEEIEEVIKKIKPKCLVIANSNSIGQIVISGYTEDIEKFKKVSIDEKKFKKLIPLPVSGAFHSPLMQIAQDEVKEDINNLNIKTPLYPILQNYSGKFETDITTIKENLSKQITAPVLWCENMQMAISQGFDTFIEIGAKNVLLNLMKRIIPEDKKELIKAINIETSEDFQKIEDIL